MITAIGGPDQLVLRGPRLPVATDHRHDDDFDVARGRRAGLLDHLGARRTSRLDDLGRPRRPDRRRPSSSTRSGPALCRADLPHADVVRRSLLTLRLLTHEETGGIVAAPTTSLPEDFGGERNWDYRYCWLRDAALTLELADRAPATPRRPRLWRGWLLRAVAGDPEDLQIMYAVDGARRLPEHASTTCPATPARAPVRIGNGAVDQRQTDVLGEVMIALEHARRAGARGRRRRLGAAARAGRRPRQAPGRSPTTGCGRSAARGGTSPTPG